VGLVSTDNYQDIVGHQAIFTPAINPDVPTQTGPVLLKWRGIWAANTLYNKNDLAKVPGLVDDNEIIIRGATLEIALQTHVSSLEFDSDIDLWGRVLDASELGGSGIPPEELQAFVDQARTYATASNNYATTASCYAAAAQTTSDAMTTNIQTALDSMDDSVGEAEIIRDSVGNIGATAQAAADQAVLAATAAPGIIVDPTTGAESAYSSMLKALSILSTTALTPYLYVDDPVSGSGQFTVTPDSSWLGRKVVVRSTRDCEIALPVNLNRMTWIDGSDAAAFFRVKPVGSGVVSIAAGVAGTITPDFIADDAYSVRQTAITGTTTILRSVTVPPGSNRYVIFQGFALYDSLDNTRAHTVTAQVRGGSSFTMTKLQGPLTVNQYNASTAQIAGTMWIGAIPNSPSAAQIIDVTCVYTQQVYLIDQYIFVGGPAASYNPTTVGFSETAATAAFADINLNVASGKAKSLAVLGWGGRQITSPTGISHGTIRHSGLTAPPADPTGGRNNSALYAYENNLLVGANTWRVTWPATTRHAALGVLLEPGAGGSTITMRTALTLTGLTQFQEVLVEALNDGLTYDIS
jgi:hypothetical protein